MGVWAFGRRHGTVRACGGGLGSTYLVGYLCSLSFPFVCRGVACNILVLVPPYPYLILFSLLRRRHTCCFCMLPMLHILLPLVGHAPLLVVCAVTVALFGAWRSAACNILALVFMCVRTFFTLLVPSYHVACPWRWRLACAGLFALHSLCVRCAGVGAGHPCVCGHTCLSSSGMWGWAWLPAVHLLALHVTYLRSWWRCVAPSLPTTRLCAAAYFLFPMQAGGCGHAARIVFVIL